MFGVGRFATVQTLASSTAMLASFCFASYGRGASAASTRTTVICSTVCTLGLRKIPH